MRRLVGGLVLAAAVLAAGCGSDDDDDAGESAPPSTAASATPDRTTVTNPRDTTVLITNPCAAFTAEQLAPYDLPPTGELQEKPSAGSPETCTWRHFGDQLKNQNVDVFVEQFDPPEDAPKYLDTGVDKRTEWVEVGGNPATLGQLFAGDSLCDVSVLIAPGRVLVVYFDRNRRSTVDPCIPGRELAEIAVSNLPPLS